MTSHETLVKVNLSCCFRVGTESHPECIDEDTMKEIVQDYLTSYLVDATSDNFNLENFDFLQVVTKEE